MRDLSFSDLPAQAHEVAAQLGLTGASFPSYVDTQRHRLAERILEGSAEHVTYYVLQSRRFTTLEPIDPVRLAATRPTEMPASVRARFADFQAHSAAVVDERCRLVRRLFLSLPEAWTPEACFRHTMQFLARKGPQAAQRPDRREVLDQLYQQRGLSSDTAPEQTRGLDEALRWMEQSKLPEGRTLLVGPGLDLTRREGFSDATPLTAYQLDRLLAVPGIVQAGLDCADVRPEVLAHLAARPVCALPMDITTQCGVVPGQYGLVIATNLLLYFEDAPLLAAMSGLVRSLKPGGVVIHNDARFAAKVFGELLGCPVERFQPISTGRRGSVEQVDRLVIHRKA
ncbi:MAG: class I SAM-dependent methyltransferase [Acidobacteria bacterium]|nr:class I SAM-dependent methyltransferase [Acidobacteriota bacterium]